MGPAPTGPAPMGPAGMPITTEAASKVVLSLATVPLAATNEPTVTSPSEALAPFFMYVVVGVTSSVVESPSGLERVITLPFTATTKPKTWGVAMSTRAAVVVDAALTRMRTC